MRISVKDLSKIGAKYKESAIRQLREPLLRAFDVYKSNVCYGVWKETQEDHEVIMTWYQDLLDKKEQALAQVPERIQKILSGSIWLK